MLQLLWRIASAWRSTRSLSAAAPRLEGLEPRRLLYGDDFIGPLPAMDGGCPCGCGGGEAVASDTVTIASTRPDPDLEDHAVLFRLPLAQDTTRHFYFDRDPGPGVLAWNNTTQSYNGHRGSDYSRIARNTPVYAAADGILIAKDDGHPDFGGPPNGNYVRLNHGNDRNGNPINSVYLHLEAGTVTDKPLGSFIAAGEYLGGVGTSGNSTGLHLHFESQLRRVAFDPYAAVWAEGELSWWVDQGAGAPSTATPPPKFIIGDIVEVFALGSSNLSVRSPNPTSPSIGTKPNGATGIVLDGPVLSYTGGDYHNNVYTRYLVQFEDDGLTGWVAQNWVRLLPDRIPPEVIGGAFHYDTLPHRVSFTFSEPVGASLSSADLLVRNPQTHQQYLPLAATYTPSQHRMNFFLPRLPDGIHRATLAAGSVQDQAGNPLAEDYVLDFFMLTGDANGDGRVDGEDFLIWQANFGTTSGATFPMGDYNYDGRVDGEDFLLWQANFGRALDLAATEGLASFSDIQAGPQATVTAEAARPAPPASASGFPAGVDRSSPNRAVHAQALPRPNDASPPFSSRPMLELGIRPSILPRVIDDADADDSDLPTDRRAAGRAPAAFG